MRRSLPRAQVKISEAYLKLADAVLKGRTLVRSNRFSAIFAITNCLTETVDCRLLTVDCRLNHILSGTFIPSNPIAEAITLAVISESFNLNCFFSSDSAFITECSV